MEQLKKNRNLILFNNRKKSIVTILGKYVKLYLTKEIVGNAFFFFKKKGTN